MSTPNQNDMIWVVVRSKTGTVGAFRLGEEFSNEYEILATFSHPYLNYPNTTRKEVVRFWRGNGASK